MTSPYFWLLGGRRRAPCPVSARARIRHDDVDDCDDGIDIYVVDCSG